MEVKIGVQSVPRELVIDSDMTPEAIEQALRDALAADHGVFAISHDKGGRLLIPVAKLGYIEISEQEPRRVGFGSI